MTKSKGLSATNLWTSLRAEAEQAVNNEPEMKAFFQRRILDHKNFGDALAYILASALAVEDIANGPTHPVLFERFKACHAADHDICAAAKKDLMAVLERDPAVEAARTPLLYFKGYQALQIYRIAHHLWLQGRKDMALYLQSKCSEIFAVDIHPAARIGTGVMIDHATGVVIGGTAVVEDDVSILHNVTLGGTGKAGTDRHPKVRKGVLIGAGAKILGNIEIGEGARVAAGAIVLRNVPPHVTVAGNPARVVGKARGKPGTVMDQVSGFSPEEPETIIGSSRLAVAGKH
jgi:serine O-acetyltransferase